MNKKITLFSWLFLTFFMPALAASGEMRLLHVDLSYSGAAASYNLYKDGVLVCVSNDPTATQMDCNVEIDATPMTFILTAVDGSGVESPQSAPYILVPPEIDPATGNFIPQAKFSASAISGQAPLAVTFDASGSSDLDGSIMSYNWNFGDGGAGTGQLLDYIFTDPGTYTVTLTVTDDQNSSGVETTTITVTASAPSTNESPVAKVTATSLQDGTSRIGFDATASSDADGVIVSYTWDFGDGDTADGNYIEHEFIAAGDYTVVLTVTDDEGASSQDQIIMSVVDTPTANVLPIAIISANSQQRLMHFEWDYTGSDPDLAGFKLYQNNRVVCKINNPAARQADCLTYVDNGTVELRVTAYNLSEVESNTSAALTFDTNGLFPEANGDAAKLIHFTSGASTDPDGTITSYKWDFSDGSTAEGMEAGHVFTVPADYIVTLTVTDNKGGQTQAKKAITINNTAPKTTNKTLTLKEDSTASGTLSATDANNDPITFSLVTLPSKGTVTLGSGTGTFTYRPKANYNGTDSFTFKANDGELNSAVAKVAISISPVNDAPKAANKTLTILEDRTVSAILPATDIDKNPLTFSLVTLPKHGKATLVNASTGAFTYRPAANYYGKDSFTYRARDGKLNSTAATVTITIKPVNDAPTARTDSAKVRRGKYVSILVLANDTDVDKNPLKVVSVTTPKRGTAKIVKGTILYTANASYVGKVTFTYTISDDQGGKATGTVNVTVEK